MYMQSQRLVGQQSLAEFMGLHLDLRAIFSKNQQKEGAGIVRKNGMIIHQGDTLTQVQIKRKKEVIKKAYGLSTSFVCNLKLPMARTKEWLKVLTLNQVMSNKNNFSPCEKIHHLQTLQNALLRKYHKIMILKEKVKNYRDCNISVVL